MSDLRFGSYRTTETIGTGSLSTIYRAVQEPLGRVVAVKALKTQIAATSSFGEQLEREAKVLADLVHPNVVLLLESGRTESGRPFLVLEHVEGASLQELEAKAKKKIPVAVALAIACGVCAALEHVHSRGVVHRDVKPGNVLLSKAGTVKLIDFGIAQRPRLGSVSDAGIPEGITATGRMAPEQLKDAYGTPAYMSPEQILGDFVDGRSDLFSLGVVLYQMLSGARPFGDDTKGATQRIRREAAPNLRSTARDVPRAVERIVMRLLEKSPNDRYPSASAVKERLEAALRSETREDPSAIVRSALVAAGLATPDPAPPEPASAEAAPVSAVASKPKPSKSRPPRRSVPALAGFVAVTAAFALAVYANEGTQRSREVRAAGAAAPPASLEGAGGLRVVATPWAYVKVDGQLVETTPFARPIALAPGRHWVTLTHPEAAPIEREITIATGETVMLDVTMDLAAGDAGKDAQAP
ncbi:MAG: serine/threonine protein kinase [Labilithrix sp.]|nr:serine/threonine protein kinase [Labilithrix sp.]MCW5810165.1 serine/threonine protein kinase [Labilithrix sp.]